MDTTSEERNKNEQIILSKLDRILSILQHLPTTHHTDLGDWLTEEQARELMHRGATSLWELRKTKKIKFSKVGNRTYYSKCSIIKYLDSNEE